MIEPSPRQRADMLVDVYAVKEWWFMPTTYKVHCGTTIVWETRSVHKAMAIRHQLRIALANVLLDEAWKRERLTAEMETLRARLSTNALPGDEVKEQP